MPYLRSLFLDFKEISKIHQLLTNTFKEKFTLLNTHTTIFLHLKNTI